MNNRCKVVHNECIDVLEFYILSVFCQKSASKRAPLSCTFWAYQTRKITHSVVWWLPVISKSYSDAWNIVGRSQKTSWGCLTSNNIALKLILWWCEKKVIYLTPFRAKPTLHSARKIERHVQPMSSANHDSQCHLGAHFLHFKIINTHRRLIFSKKWQIIHLKPSKPQAPTPLCTYYIWSIKDYWKTMKSIITSIAFMMPNFLREIFCPLYSGEDDGKGDRKGPSHNLKHLFPISYIS